MGNRWKHDSSIFIPADWFVVNVILPAEEIRAGIYILTQDVVPVWLHVSMLLMIEQLCYCLYNYVLLMQHRNVCFIMA